MSALNFDGVLPRGNFLRPNGLGGYIIRQSDLSSWARCQLQKYYYDLANNDPEAAQPSALSATEFGSVYHFVAMNLELLMEEGHEDPLGQALKLWEHYWDLDNMTTIPGVLRPTEWIARDTFAGLKARGRAALPLHYELLKSDKSLRLALEYQFAVPMVIEGRTHTLTGTIDRLSTRVHSNRRPYIAADDNKTGKKPFFLRWNMQFTAYSYATTMPEFWLGWAESGMPPLETFPEDVVTGLEGVFESHGYSLHRGSPTADRLPLASRRARWIDLKDVKFSDAGWRTDNDYGRLHLAVDAYVRSCEAEIYSLTTTGEVCNYCSFKKTCAGAGVADMQEGAPL